MYIYQFLFMFLSASSVHTRKMFVSACGTSSTIEVLQMDGTSRMTVVNRGIACPTSLTLDHHSRRIYWLDKTRGVFESVYFNGANREVMYFEQGVYPQGFTLDGSYAFLTDEKRGTVYKIGIHDKSNATLVTGIKKPTTIRYFNTTSLTNGKQKSETISPKIHSIVREGRVGKNQKQPQVEVDHNEATE